MKRLPVAMLLTILCVQSAFSQERFQGLTVRVLHELCKGTLETQKLSCGAFFFGAVDTMRVAAADYKDRGAKLVCLNGVALSDVAETFMTEAEKLKNGKRPDLYDKGAAALLYVIVRESWSCPASQ